MSKRPFRFVTRTWVTSEAPPDVVFDTIADLRNHLEWSGERATDDSFKLTSLEAPKGPAEVGTMFTSTGANFNGTFHDRSVVAEMRRPTLFVIETDARLERTRGRPWEVHFSHRYDIEADGGGSRVVYTETISRVNYVPYWLQPWIRPLSRMAIDRGDRKQLQNLARLAEEHRP